MRSLLQGFVISRFHYNRLLSKDIFVHLVKGIRSFGLFCGCSFKTVQYSIVYLYCALLSKGRHQSRYNKGFYNYNSDHTDTINRSETITSIVQWGQKGTINHFHYCEKTTCAVWRSAEVNLIKKSSAPSALISGLEKLIKVLFSAVLLPKIIVFISDLFCYVLLYIAAA